MDSLNFLNMQKKRRERKKHQLAYFGMVTKFSAQHSTKQCASYVAKITRKLMIRKLEMVEQSTVQFGGEKYRNIFISGKPQITDSPQMLGIQE